jgi:hypothetical protein
MTRAFTMATVIALGISSLAFAAVAAATEPVADKVPGTVSCLQLRSINSTEVVDDKTIIFKMNGRKSYKNTLPYKCPQLGFQKAFSYKTSGSQLCSVDIITVLETGGGIRQGASCGLGKFEPYTPPAKVKK